MQYNIYFRKDNWEKFKDEVGKSNLVNQLLAEHYGFNSTPEEDLSESVKISPDLIELSEEEQRMQDYIDTLVLDPTNPNRAFDEENSVNVRVKSKNGKIIEIVS